MARFLLGAGIRMKKVYRFGGYTPVKCFNIFKQSVVNALHQGDEEPNSSVVAET